MTLMEKRARAYCAEIGADPDEVVWGYWVTDRPRWTSAPRWAWYQ